MADPYERPEGVTDAEWRLFLKEMDDMEEALKKRICRLCGSPLSKTLDKRQDGNSDKSGLWFNYRCTNPACCTFFVDQKEAN